MSDEKTMVRHEEKAPERIQQRRTVTPPVDIYENEREILLVADIPGVNTDTLRINLEGGELNIEGCRAHTTRGTLVAEMYETCDYLRSFKIPNTIDTGKIDAELTNGVLKVHLPKMETLQPRRIEVKVG
ncbi:MAG: Hsp20/alpha crystallin family protein [Bradymonadales bacterium]|nr:Hsp20/alpha crystallin family protein [Bradymonadales bacterium]